MPITISADIRLFVRRRADYACEYCGITEVEAGGELTVDHFHPLSKGGDDSLDNLVYCCVRCNRNKWNYWPEQPDDVMLWHPRHEPAAIHLRERDDGWLQHLTETGAVTVQLLQLNRPALVEHRRQARRRIEVMLRRRELILSAVRALRRRKPLNNEEQETLRILLQLWETFDDENGREQ